MHISLKMLIAAIIGINSVCATVHAQEEKPIVLERKLLLRLSNSSSRMRVNEPVCIPVSEIMTLAPDFNPSFFRLKHPSGGFEPLDIPSQIIAVPSALAPSKELVFTIDLNAGTDRVVELWYTPEGDECMPYPAETQSFSQWYHLGSNIAWENREIAYRSYSGIVDFFAKSYPHLRLHNLPPDSYHHERFWGLDPYMVGAKPGLCGVILGMKAGMQPCYGDPETTGLSYTHIAIEGGPVCTGAIVQVRLNGELLSENIYRLYAGRAENRVTTILSKKMRGEVGDIYIGMQSFESPAIVVRNGFLSFVGNPVEEYGTIYTGLAYDTSMVSDTLPLGDGQFAVMKPDADGAVHYASVARWSRGSAENADNEGLFLSYLESISYEMRSPIRYSLSIVR